MSDVPGPKHPLYDPFEDDGTGYIDARPGVTVGAYAALPLFDMTDDEVEEYLECVQKRKRQPIGFQLPAREEPHGRPRRSHR